MRFFVPACWWDRCGWSDRTDVSIGHGGFGDGFLRGAEQVRKKSFRNVANDGIDDPRERKWHGAAEFDGFHLNVGSSVFFLDVPPGAKLPEITM